MLKRTFRFKIFVLKQIFAKMQANMTFKRIFACKIFAYKQIFTSKYSREGVPLQRGGGGHNGCERGVVSRAVASHSASHGWQRRITGPGWPLPALLNSNSTGGRRTAPAVSGASTPLTLGASSDVALALQMKVQWESNINVWFPFINSQKWNSYFQNRIIMFCLPVPKLIYLWEIYIFPRSVCLFCCREICGLILEIYKWLKDTWMWKLGLRPRNSQERNT